MVAEPFVFTERAATKVLDNRQQFAVTGQKRQRVFGNFWDRRDSEFAFQSIGQPNDLATNQLGFKFRLLFSASACDLVVCVFCERPDRRPPKPSQSSRPRPRPANSRTVRARTRVVDRSSATTRRHGQPPPNPSGISFVFHRRHHWQPDASPTSHLLRRARMPHPFPATVVADTAMLDVMNRPLRHSPCKDLQRSTVPAGRPRTDQPTTGSRVSARFPRGCRRPAANRIVACTNLWKSV